MKMNRWLAGAAITAAVCLGATQGLAQQDNQGQGQGRRGRGGNFDPAQMRQQMMDNLKEQLDVKDDSEWKAIQPLIEKVMEARRGTMMGMGRGMFGGPRRPGGNADQAQQPRGPFGQAPSPEVEALQRAVDGKASNAELKTAIAKVSEGRKAKQAELEKAQENLRKVLSVKQEAVATLNGLL